MDWIVSLPERLDTFLTSQGALLSRSKVQQAIETGAVSVNDEVARKVSFRLQEGDKVVLSEELIPPVSSTIEPADLQLSVLYEDDACLVIDKPAGYSVHPGAGMLPGEKTILHGVGFLFQQRSIPFSGESVLVHRLDKETTGCLLIAKTPETHLQLQKQFETRTVRKLYLALVAGVPTLAEAKVDAPVGRSVTDRTKMSVMGATASREAQTTYRTLAQSSSRDMALLECDLHTGRTHQVRVHLSSIGHPVLGDGSYTSELSQRQSDQYDIRSLCLHAWKLRFTSPADQKEHEVMAPLPREFGEILKRVGIDIRL